MPMPATWILVADSARARLFSLDEEHGLGEIQTFVNVEGRLPAQALQRDRPPRTHDRFGDGRHAIEPHTPTHDKSLTRFAGLLQSTLERGRVEHRFDSLVLIAPPHFLGVLNTALGKHLRACLTLEIGKDMTREAPAAIGAKLLATLDKDVRGGPEAIRS